jgi:hypothetical protein
VTQQRFIPHELVIPWFEPRKDSDHDENWRAVDRWANVFVASVDNGFGGNITDLFGDGSDGQVTVSSAGAIPPWATRVGTTYFLQRDVFCTNLTLSNSSGNFVLVPVDVEAVTGVSTPAASHRIYCTGTLTIDVGVTIRCNGSGASGVTHGNPGVNGGTLGQSGPGSNGSAGAAATPSSLADSILPTAEDVPGGVVFAKRGGVGGSATGGGGVGGGSAAATATRTYIYLKPTLFPNYLTLLPPGDTRFYSSAVGGTGGNGAGGGTGGGGGGGGGGVALYAKNLLISGTVQALGGAGAAGSGGNAGGGGGGGGGYIMLVFRTLTVTGTTSVLGGSGGALSGTGNTGGSGDAGVVFQIQV